MAEPFIGEIRMFPYTFTPYQWAECRGQYLPIMQNQALYAVIGTIYGGDGRTTLRLPNLQGAVPMHWGDGPGLTPHDIGDPFGNSGIRLTSNQLPPHTHTLNVSKVTLPESAEPDESKLPHYLQDRTQTPPLLIPLYCENPGSTTGLSEEAISVTGGSYQHENRQPYLCIKFFIALDGTFPPRA